MKQKGQTLIFVLLGIVMIAFVGVAFYAGKITPKPPSQVVTSTSSPTPSPSPVDETANWKTYTDSEGRYSFQYPGKWYLYPDQYDKNEFVIYDRPRDQIPPGGGDSNSIDIAYETGYGNARPTDLLPYAILYDNGYSKPNPTTKLYSVNNYSGIRGQTRQGQDIILLKNPNDPNGTYIQIALWSSLEDEDIFSHLLSTFKFLK